MVDMTHECDDGGTQLLFLGLLLKGLGRFHHYFFLLVDSAASNALLTFEDETVHLAQLGCYLRLNRLVDVGENLHSHQILDDLEGRNLHLDGQFLDLDRRLDVNDFARVNCILRAVKRGGYFFGHRFRDQHHRGGLLIANTGKSLGTGSRARFGDGFVD